MAKYNTQIVTASGLAIIAQAQTGDTINFTAIKAGNGVYTESDNPGTQTNLKSVKQSFAITGIRRTNDTQALVRAVMSNEGVTIGYNMTELGLFATDPSTQQEVLYAIIIAQSGYEDYMPAFSETPSAITLEMYIDATELSEVTFEASAVPGTYATVEDLEEAYEDLSEISENTITFEEASEYSELTTGDTLNILFGKIKKFFSNITTRITTAEGKIADTKDSKVTFTTASSDANINSGEKHSVMFGKIKKFISTVTSSLSSITSSISTLQTNVSKRNMITYSSLYNLALSDNNTITQVINAMEIGSVLDVVAVGNIWEVVQNGNTETRRKTSSATTFYNSVVQASGGIIPTDGYIRVNVFKYSNTKDIPIEIYYYRNSPVNGVQVQPHNEEYVLHGMYSFSKNTFYIKRCINEDELTSQINSLTNNFSNIGRKYVLLGAANSSTGSSDVKTIPLQDDFTKYNELMFVMDINGTQYNPTVIPVERFYNSSTIALSHTDDGGTIWAKAISYSTTSVGYSASSNIVTLAIYGVI